jgi:hypothetical protein
MNVSVHNRVHVQKRSKKEDVNERYTKYMMIQKITRLFSIT